MRIPVGGMKGEGVRELWTRMWMFKRGEVIEGDCGRG